MISMLNFIEIPRCNANSVDPDQPPHSAASDLGLSNTLSAERKCVLPSF